MYETSTMPNALTLDAIADVVVERMDRMPATAFISYRDNDKSQRFLAIDTHPDEAWGAHVHIRQIIGTFKGEQLVDIIKTYAPML